MCQNSELQETWFCSDEPLPFQPYGSASLPPPLPRALPTNPPRLPHCCCCWYCSFDMATFISHWEWKVQVRSIIKGNHHKPFSNLENTRQKIKFGHPGALPDKTNKQTNNKGQLTLSNLKITVRYWYYTTTSGFLIFCQQNNSEKNACSFFCLYVFSLK